MRDLPAQSPQNAVRKRVALLAVLWLVLAAFGLAFFLALSHLYGQPDLRAVLFWVLVLLVIPSFVLAAIEVTRDLLTDRYG